jgi:hypothetical protein
MSGDDLAGIIVAAIVMVYLIYARIFPERLQMNAQGWSTYISLGILLVISTPILGNYTAKVYIVHGMFGDRIAGPVERTVYRVTGIDPEGEQRWSTYVVSLLIFSLVGVLVLYAVLNFRPTFRSTVVISRPRTGSARARRSTWPSAS